MNHPSHFRAAFVTAFLALIGTPLTYAQITLADIAGDYATSGPLTDTFGTGTWTYHASSAATAGTLTALSYGAVGDGSTGYGLYDGGFNLPGVSTDALFTDGATPASDQLAWHPSEGSTEFTLLRWTAGVGEAGTIRLQGVLTRTGEPGGAVDFFIFVNGVESFTRTDILMDTFFAYDFTANISTGQTVDFVLGNSGNSFAADESLISGTITSAIPEPSTYAILAGLAALGLVAVRKRAGK